MTYPFLPVNPCCTDVVLNSPCECGSTISNCSCNNNSCSTHLTASSTIVYNGPALSCTTAEPCDTLNVILQKIDEIICNLLTQINILNIQLYNITEQIINIEGDIINIYNTLDVCCVITTTTTTTAAPTNCEFGGTAIENPTTTTTTTTVAPTTTTTTTTVAPTTTTTTTTVAPTTTTTTTVAPTNCEFEGTVIENTTTTTTTTTVAPTTTTTTTTVAPTTTTTTTSSFTSSTTTSSTTATPVISNVTEINIWFDNSGSMGSTLPPLEYMRDNLLKDCIGPIYGYDPSVPGSDALYNTRVRVLNMKTIQGGVIIWDYSERFVQCLATSKNFNRTADATVNQVLNLTFQDESDPYGYGVIGGAFNNSIIAAQYAADITTLRTNVAANPGIKGIAYRVNTLSPSTGGTAFPGFRGLTQATFVNTGIYIPNANISDLPQFTYELDVTAGVPITTTPAAAQAPYYLTQVTNGLNTLGFSVSCSSTTTTTTVAPTTTTTTTPIPTTTTTTTTPDIAPGVALYWHAVVGTYTSINFQINRRRGGVVTNNIAGAQQNYGVSTTQSYNGFNLISNVYPDNLQVGDEIQIIANSGQQIPGGGGTVQLTIGLRRTLRNISSYTAVETQTVSGSFVSTQIPVTIGSWYAIDPSMYLYDVDAVTQLV